MKTQKAVHSAAMRKIHAEVFKEIPFIVEGQFRAVPEDASCSWFTVARFKYESNAKQFIRLQEDINGESAYVDRMWVRLVPSPGKDTIPDE
jgi:hypothetical protein